MPPKAKKEDNTAAQEDRLTRIAIVSTDRCRPKKCRHECKKCCPVATIGARRAWDAPPAPQPRALTPRVAGKLCIEVNPGSKTAFLSEELCIGCGICVKVRARARAGHALPCNGAGNGQPAGGGRALYCPRVVTAHSLGGPLSAVATPRNARSRPS